MPKPGHMNTLDELQGLYRGQIVEHKIPTRLHVTDRLPRTAVGKLHKQEIRSWFWGDSVRRVN